MEVIVLPHYLNITDYHCDKCPVCANTLIRTFKTHPGWKYKPVYKKIDVEYQEIMCDNCYHIKCIECNYGMIATQSKYQNESLRICSACITKKRNNYWFNRILKKEISCKCEFDNINCEIMRRALVISKIKHKQHPSRLEYIQFIITNFGIKDCAGNCKYKCEYMFGD